MADKSAARVTIDGNVQGVGFRNFAHRYAFLLSLKGFVKNLPNGQVEIEIEGDKEKINLFVEHLHRGPSLSKVLKVDVTWGTYSERFKEFSIIL
jgi:acylphosphatase